MSISPLGGAQTPAPTTAGAAANPNRTANAAGNGTANAASGSQGSPTTIVNVVTETNADGSVTTITTYGDGSTKTVTAPPPPSKAGPGGLGGLLHGGNGAQGNTLIAAQALATTGAGTV